MSEELKVCPFCGEMPILYEDKRSVFYSHWWINCNKCLYAFGGDADKQIQIDKWNTRKEPKP